MKLAGVLALVFLAAARLSAQDSTATPAAPVDSVSHKPERPTRLTLGIEFGYSRAGFTGKDSRGVTLREGAVAGGYFQIPLGKWLTVRPGLQMASKGGATTVAATDSTGPTRVELDLVYLDLPLLLRARLPGVAGLRLILTGGVVPGFRIGCNVDFSQGGVSLQRTDCGKNANAVFRSWDFGVLAGAGIAIPIEAGELSLEARFSQGLQSVSDLGDIKNRAVTFTISVPF